MTNYDTVRSITDNLRKALQNEGVNFSVKGYDDLKAIPASLMPLGEILYTGEKFENTHGQRPGYAEAGFTLHVVLGAMRHEDMVREQEMWVHKIRGALTVSALNAGDLASARHVSRVSTSGVEVRNTQNAAMLVYRIEVRYREV